MILQELIVLFKRIFVLLFDYSSFQFNLSGFYEALFSTAGEEQILFAKEPFSPDWLMIFFFLQVILIAWLRLYYPNRLKLLTNSYFNNRFIDQLTREEKSDGIYNWVVEFLYFLTFSIFLFISNKTFSVFNFKLEWSGLDYLFISLGLLLFILVKSLVMRFIAWLFDMETRFEDVHFYRFLNHSILSFSLFPLLILSTYLVPNSNFWHYSLQLNTYKYLLEKNYGETIKDMYLVCLHPNNSNNSYQRIKVPDLQSEIEELMELRKAML